VRGGYRGSRKRLRPTLLAQSRRARKRRIPEPVQYRRTAVKLALSVASTVAVPVEVESTRGSRRRWRSLPTPTGIGRGSAYPRRRRRPSRRNRREKPIRKKRRRPPITPSRAVGVRSTGPAPSGREADPRGLYSVCCRRQCAPEEHGPETVSTATGSSRPTQRDCQTASQRLEW